MTTDCPICTGGFRALVRNLRTATSCFRCGRRPDGKTNLGLKAGVCRWCRGVATRTQRAKERSS